MPARHIALPFPTRLSLLAVAVITAFSVPATSMAAVDRPALGLTEALQQLSSNVGGQLQSTLVGPEAYANVHALSGKVLMQDGAAGTPLERAQSFLSIYGSVLGVTSPLTELKQQRLSQDNYGGTHVHLDQFYEGLPVFGARVIVHMNSQGITGTNGVFVKDLAGLSVEAKKTVAEARAVGLAATRKLHPKASLSVESSRLMIYRSGLLKGVEGKNFLAYEVIVKGAAGQAVRERIILNANTGGLLNRINEIHTVLNREIYTPTMDVPPLLTEGTFPAPADPAFKGDTKGNPASSRVPSVSPTSPLLPLNNLYIFAGGTYNLYKNLFGREGYDDGATEAAKQVQRSVYLANENCPNAYWDGTSTNYCPGFDADDVVSHEWSHAYTEYTHGLVYQYQSGALNEAYSDIFGETYDLINGLEGPLGATLTEGKTYDQHGSRWVVGEDLSEAGAALLLRDMWDPDSFPSPSPGSVITSENYACGTSDNGGVHTNSGVANHAFAMLVDGKTFNGVTVPAIGLNKAVRIYFQAETVYQTPTTNYSQHATALEQSCADLIGKPLNDVFGKVSTDVITAADCAAVSKVIEAVEFRGKPDMTVAQKCEYKPVIEPEASAPTNFCATGTYQNPTFAENWEGGIPSTWTQSANLTGDFGKDLMVWTPSSDLPAPHTGKAAFAVDYTGGTCTTGGDHSGSFRLDSPQIEIPGDKSYLSFTHFMQSEAGYDGGNLKFSVDGGTTWTIVPKAAFFYGAYNGAFADAPLVPGVPDPVGLSGNNTNPLAGEAAWTGSDQGEATGSWGTTIVDISKLSGATKGGKLQFRWEFGQDGCGGNLGWFVDDLSVGYCSTTAPANKPPVATLTSSVSSGAAPLAVTFTISGRDTDIGDRAVSYTLDFGDGSTKLTDQSLPTAGTTVSHSYTKAGSYTAKLTVKDTRGATSAATSRAITATSTGSGGGGGGGTDGGSKGGGGGALNWLLLAPFAILGLLRRRKR